MTKHPVANLALSCLLSWSMIVSGFMPTTWAFADEASPAAQEAASQEADGPAADEPAGDTGDAADAADGPSSDDPAAGPDVPSGDASDEGGDQPASTDAPASSDQADSADGSADGTTSSDPAADASQGAASDEPAADQPEQPAALSPEEALSLVYVLQGSVAQGQAQQVALMLADSSREVASARLTLQTPQGEFALDASAFDAQAMLFDVDTSALAQGTTALGRLDVSLTDGTSLAVDFSLSADVYSFEVTEPVEPTFDLTAYTVDDSGELVETADVAQALDAAGASQALAVTLAQGDDGVAVQSKGLVIALDPGHDESSYGAQGQGLAEEKLTLKIAQACRDELATYPGVSVYMTRETAACPYFPTGEHSESDCLKRRVTDAVKAGASIFVSIHINSSDYSTSHGAEVWYPSFSAGDVSVSQDGKKLAESIQQRLAALGLADRGAKENDTYTDDDDVERDYYSVIRNSKANGVPGVIIEHAFITSPTDYSYLASDAALKRLGVADANGIASFFGLSKTKDNSQVSLARIAVADVDGGKATARLRATGVPTTASRYFATVTFADKSTSSVEFSNLGNGTWEGTLALPDGFVIQEVSIKGYMVDSSGKQTPFSQLTTQIKLFSDLVAQSWYLDYVGNVVRDGIMTGYTDDDGVSRTFGPEDSLTRAQAITLLYRIANPGSSATTDSSSYGTSSSFSDVPARQYFTAAVQWGVSSGIVTGDRYDDGTPVGTFRPYDLVTREEFATMLYRYAQACGAASASAGGSVSSYPDGASVSGYARTAMGWCVSKGILTGDTASGVAMLNPRYGATRAQAAKMLDVFCDVAGQGKPNGTPSGDVSVSALSRRMSDDGKGYQLWTPSGEVAKTGSVKVAVWKSGSDASTAKWYTARYVSSASEGLEDDMVGGWLAEVPLADLPAGTYVAQAWAAASPQGQHKACAKVGLSTSLHPIMKSSGTVTAAQLVAAYKASGATYPADVYKSKGAATVEDFCRILVEEAKAEGVDPGVVFCQAMLETGYLRFGGAVKAAQCNFAGLGATGGSAAGGTFSSVREGLRAQVQHLRLYADSSLSRTDSQDSAGLLANPVVDQRFFTYLAGSSPYLEGLGTRWASGSSYGWTLGAMLDGLR